MATSNTTEQHIGWGKPSIFIKDLEAESPVWVKIPTPVEDSTELTVTQGEKHEATIEGGEAEDTKYEKNKSSLSYKIRLASNRTMPIYGSEGVVEHKYAVLLIPENAAAPGFYMPRTTVTVVPDYKSSDGSAWTYTHDALIPIDESNGGQSLRFGVFTASGTEGSYSFSAKGIEFSADGETL